MSSFYVTPIVCDYAVREFGRAEIICICSVRENAELIADILNADMQEQTAYAYSCYPYAKYKVSTADSEVE